MEFSVDGDHYELPELDTRTWLDALCRTQPGCWLSLIPAHVAGRGAQQLSDRLFDPEDPFDLDDMEHVAERVLTEACGIDLYPACQLAAIAWGNWLSFTAWCCTVGFAPLAEPVDRTLAAVWGWRLSLCGNKSDLARLESDVWVLPPDTTASGKPRDAGPPAWSDDMEAAAFEAAFATWGRNPAPAS